MNRKEIEDFDVFCSMLPEDKNAYMKNQNNSKSIKEFIRTCNDDELVTLLCELVDSGILQEWRIKYHCADSDEDAVRMWLKEKYQYE